MTKITKIENVTVEHNFNEVKYFFSMSDKLDRYNPERVYRERTEDAKSFEATYKFSAIRNSEYNQFKNMMQNELRTIEKASEIKERYNGTNTPIERIINDLDYIEVRNITSRWVSHEAIDYMQDEKAFKERYNFLIEDGYTRSAEILREEATKLKKEVEAILKKANFKKALEIHDEMTFEQWQTGKLSNGQKLGKAIGKVGYSSSLLDFYSAQIKEEEDYYITISGAPQMVAGISNYAKAGSWNGYNGTSCQDTRFNSGMEKNLLGNLYDTNLVSIMLHKELEDLKDMTDKLLARATARVFYHDEIAVLVPNKVYGNNVTGNALKYGLELLAGLKIGITREQYAREGGYNNSVVIKDEQPQAYEGYDSSIYYADYSGYYHVHYDCPVCEGDGEVTAMNEHDQERYFTCPLCDGDGEIEQEIEVDWREGEVEYEDEDEELIGSYEDGSLYYSYHSVTIRVNEEELLEQVQEVINAEIEEGKKQEILENIKGNQELENLLNDFL